MPTSRQPPQAPHQRGLHHFRGRTMLLETLDARITRALQRVRIAREQGHPTLIANCEKQLDALLDRRLEVTSQ